jgi:hypothetical protein
MVGKAVGEEEGGEEEEGVEQKKRRCSLVIFCEPSLCSD